MAFIRQTWTLTEKTLRIVLWRHLLGTLVRALIAPVIFMFFISYAKNFFVPPSTFGIGSPAQVRSLSDAVAASAGVRDTVVFVNNGYTGGAISNVISQLSGPIEAQGKTVQVLESESGLLTTCRSSIRGVSPCFAAVEFISSPTEGTSGIWNYTIRADGALSERIYVDSNSNDGEIYVIPIQHAVDSAIASLNGTTLTDNIMEYPYTSETAAQRQRNITRLYMGSLISILAVAYFVGIVGICYQLTGEMAKERELGMSQLIEAMMPNKRRWVPQAARILSIHLAFDILYLPSWIIMAVIVGLQNYTFSNVGIMVGYFILSGLALSSWSIAFASLFRRAQLSGITVTIVSIVLAIIIQVIPPVSTAAAIVLTLLFPPMNFTLFIIYMAYWQQKSLPANLALAAPTAPWGMPGWLFFLWSILQIIVLPLLGAYIERSLYGTASKARRLRYGEESAEAVKITGVSKLYPPNWWHRRVGSRFSKTPRQTVRAVDDVDLSVLRGQILVLLGANGSGKSTTLDMLAGLQKPTSGTIEMDATGSIGLCPQKNVLWDELTVYEHVRIFNRLKATKLDSKAEMQQLVAGCDLEQKFNAMSGTLSGGQKRKCQLAMMLTGGSTLCMLDEVSSGLDPLSRRKIWDVLLAERGKRSMILTTHFLDEADLLSDDISILSKGKRVANGSAVALKHELRGGYRVRIYHENKRELPTQLEDTPKQVYHDQTVYQLADSAAAARFVAELEQAGVQDYQVNGPTIEDVFLKLAEEVKQELAEDRAPSPVSDATGSKSHEERLQLVTGRNISYLGQTWVLFRKRATVGRRNAWPYLAALLIPIITAGLVTLFLKNFSALSCSPTNQVSNSTAAGLDNFLGVRVRIPQGPAGQVPLNLINEVYPLLTPPPFRNVTTLDALNAYIARNYSRVEPGGFFLGDTPTFAWRGNYDMYYASLQLILYFGLAMCAYPGFFALYPNRERLHKVRALHYSNGIRAPSLWTAYLLFDLIIVLAVATIAIIIFTAASNVWYAPGYLWLVFTLFGLTATLMSYVVSLFTTSQLAAFAFAAGGQCVFFLLYFIAYLCTITYAPAYDTDRDINIVTYTVGAFLPAANLLRSLLLTFNEFSALCRGTELALYPGAWSVYGSCIAYLIIQAVVLMLVLIASDSGWRPGFVTRTKHKPQDVEEVDDVDPEVYAEAARTEECKDDLRVMHASKVFGTNVAVQDVSFAVPKGEVFALLGPNGAGKSTTIGLIRGDTRPTGQQSDILIEDVSIIARRAAARANLGVCPQFDAMDQMTAVEHLRFYARARGVPDVEHNVEQVLRAVGLTPFKARMAGKLSGGNKRKLSLGISLIGNPSVVLLDEPSSGMDAASKRVMWRTLSAVSSGRALVLTTHSMEEADALADRAGIMAKRMLALGTSDQLRKKHGDAYHVHLVHRDAPYTSEANMQDIKFFTRSTFPGAVVEERTFHGQLRFSVPNDRSATDNSIEIVHADPDKKMTSTSTRTSRSGIAALFAELERNKEKLGFEYYSVSQATLDQVFLSIVNKHNVVEENYARQHTGQQHGDWKRLGRGVKGKSYLCF
ncbi:putative ABC transporter [Teratosphaeria nubilosa]|uniref:Putative ABC transporter n=1 Tax=Teratosphaeria nubilosa TaxID=161662 RepID=A0A6G1L3W0_9PEZI|nr:putative ABC transporter [Teratosphaeria nubilosa]